MTVGIGAIAQKGNDPRVVVSADRMVTIGRDAGIEYEDHESKLEVIEHNDRVCAVGIGSGSSAYLDELFKNIGAELAGEAPRTVRSVLNHSLAAYQALLRSSISNQVLAPLGYDLDDLKNGTEIPPEIQKTIAQKVEKYRKQYRESLSVLIAGVGVNGAGIFQLAGSDYTNQTEPGYLAIGSGSASATLTFIRRGYDPATTLRDGIFTVLEAKTRSEERQGVGQQMDMAIIEQGSIRTYDRRQIVKLRDLLGDIRHEERQARERVMDKWTP